ncbi:MAG: hypothetical protein ACRDD3_09970 [Azovibrio sp.]
METELEALAAKVEKVVLLVEELRAENASLQRRLETAESEQDLLRKNMEAARSRVENLMSQLPEDE